MVRAFAGSPQPPPAVGPAAGLSDSSDVRSDLAALRDGLTALRLRVDALGLLVAEASPDSRSGRPLDAVDAHPASGIIPVRPGAEGLERTDDGDPSSGHSPSSLTEGGSAGPAWVASPDPFEVERRIVRAYDDALAGEQRDPRWSWQMESEMRATGRLPAMGNPEFRSIECRATLCRVQVAFGSVADREAFRLAVHNTKPWMDWGEAFFRLEGLDDLAMEVYTSREGHHLPPLPQDVAQ